MAGWKDLLIDILKLTDEVKRLNQSVERLQGYVVDVDKRLVRMETLVEVAGMKRVKPKKPKLES